MELVKAIIDNDYVTFKNKLSLNKHNINDIFIFDNCYYPCNINIRASMDQIYICTLLCYACSENKYKFVKLLIKQKTIDLNKESIIPYFTPLYSVIYEHNYKIVDLLFRHQQIKKSKLIKLFRFCHLDEYFFIYKLLFKNRYINFHNIYSFVGYYMFKTVKLCRSFNYIIIFNLPRINNNSTNEYM